MGGAERARKVVEQIGEISRQRCRPRDQNIVMPIPPMKGKNGRSRSPKPPFRPVAGDSVADLAAGGEADPDMAGNGLGRGAKFQRQAGGRTSDTPRRAQEIWTIFKAIHDGHLGPAGRIRRRVSCGHAHGGAPAPCVHRPWPCANGIHDAACGRSCSADRGASWLIPGTLPGLFERARFLRGRGGRVNRPGALHYFIPKIRVSEADLPFSRFI